MRVAARFPAAVCAAMLMLAACGGAQSDQANGGQPLPTPQASSSTAVADTVAILTTTLARRGFQVMTPLVPYRPSEPASLTQVPRTVLQVAGEDADQGYVVVYAFPTDDAAATAGAELARYVASGFGQTNFPTDAQFSVAQVGSTIVFTWYSGARASDPVQAREAFFAVQTVGQPFPVVK
jgi:hypothetical protein